jgi:hypothetical protein
MGNFLLIPGLALPWLLGIVVLLAWRSAQRPLAAPGEIAWIAGAGFFTGAFLLTLWMRVLSLVGIKFSLLAVGGPLLVVAVGLAVLVARRGTGTMARDLRAALRSAFAMPDLAPVLRLVWWLLLAWLGVRLALLAVEVFTRPLYPWDAWMQWATKARVWYELGTIVPFARINEWLAANGTAWFDAAPEYPPTMPLLQVWSCLVLGRWDDTLMNGAWWQVAVALALAVYGGLRTLGVAALAALVGTVLVASLPLANVHVALAGYADLPLAAWYTAAALAFLRWNQQRDWREAALVVLLLAACTQIKNPGYFWALTLVPALLVALLPRLGIRIAVAGFAAAFVALIALAQFRLTIFNYQLKLDFDPAWGDLIQSYFLLGNWHLLWFGVIAAAALAWRSLLQPALAPLTTMVAAGLVFLFFVFAFTNASAFITDQTTVNRATLHLAPLMVVFMVLAWSAFAQRWRAAHPAPAIA